MKSLFHRMLMSHFQPLDDGTEEQFADLDSSVNGLLGELTANLPQSSVFNDALDWFGLYHTALELDDASLRHNAFSNGTNRVDPNPGDDEEPPSGNGTNWVDPNPSDDDDPPSGNGTNWVDPNPGDDDDPPSGNGTNWVDPNPGDDDDPSSGNGTNWVDTNPGDDDDPPSGNGTNWIFQSLEDSDELPPHSGLGYPPVQLITSSNQWLDLDGW